MAHTARRTLSECVHPSRSGNRRHAEKRHVCASRRREPLRKVRPTQVSEPCKGRHPSVSASAAALCQVSPLMGLIPAARGYPAAVAVGHSLLPLRGLCIFLAVIPRPAGKRHAVGNTAPQGAKDHRPVRAARMWPTARAVGKRGAIANRAPSGAKDHRPVRAARMWSTATAVGEAASHLSLSAPQGATSVRRCIHRRALPGVAPGGAGSRRLQLSHGCRRGPPSDAPGGACLYSPVIMVVWDVRAGDRAP